MMIKRRLHDIIFRVVSFSAAALLVMILAAILVVITIKGMKAMGWGLITQVPTGGFYLGGKGGIANAIVGSLYLGIGATILALIISIPTVLYLRVYAAHWFAVIIRTLLDILWGNSLWRVWICHYDTAWHESVIAGRYYHSSAF